MKTNLKKILDSNKGLAEKIAKKTDLNTSTIYRMANGKNSFYINKEKVFDCLVNMNIIDEKYSFLGLFEIEVET